MGKRGPPEGGTPSLRRSEFRIYAVLCNVQTEPPKGGTPNLAPFESQSEAERSQVKPRQAHAKFTIPLLVCFTIGLR